MQVSRLFEMLQLLSSGETWKAREMAAHFGCCQRTIYRYVEVLHNAGVPVQTTKGRGGGIRLSPEPLPEKFMLSQEQKRRIMNTMKVYRAADETMRDLGQLLHTGSADRQRIGPAPKNPI